MVATSASAEELGGLLKALGAEWLVDETTTSSDAERSKPDPDIVRVALDKAGVGPARSVMLGDTPYDVEAAKRALVRVVAVRCGGWGDEQLKGAAEIHDDPAAVLSRYEETLIGRGVRLAGRSPLARGDGSGRRLPGADEQQRSGNVP